MKKIVLIEPVERGDHVFSWVRMPRLGLPLLGALLKEAGYQVELYKDRAAALPWPRILAADLVGISTTTSTCHEAYRMASYLRSRYLPVILGGIHVTFLPEEGLQYADYVVRGEADSIILPLVRAIEEGIPPAHVPGVSYRQGSKIVHNPCPTEAEDLDLSPCPDFSLFYDPKKISGVIPVVTSRGCPYNCTFCSVTAMFGRRYRFRSTENVLRELERYRNRFIFFCDDNFTANYRRTIELLQGMLERKIDLKGWSCQVRVEAARQEELLDLMRRSGAKIAYVGFESINPATLEALNKQQSPEDIRLCIKQFHEYGIRVHGMFVFGEDSDTVQTIRDTVDFALETGIDTVQFLTLTPLPGTPFFEKLEEEGRLLTREWNLYDGHHAVFEPARMSPEQLQQETENAFKRFYSFRHAWQNVAVTGWGSSLYRLMGWWLVRRFEQKNRWYYRFLEHFRGGGSLVKTVLSRNFESLRRLLEEGTKKALRPGLFKVYLTERDGALYLRLRGVLNLEALQELKKLAGHRALQGYGKVVLNLENLQFSSEKVIRPFSHFLEQLGQRARRLQVVCPSEEKGKSLFRHLKNPCFELLSP